MRGGDIPTNLDHVVPWGRSLDEYIRMFALQERELAARILDCGGGPASFNAEMRDRGRFVVSCDPIYRFAAEDISRRISETSETILRKTIEARDNFLWTELRSPEHLLQVRLDAMDRFLDDFAAGIAGERYRIAELPVLPFRDNEFDLALCSHFLFTYAHLFPLEFHLASARELCRVSREARIFPLLPNFGNARCAHVAPLIGQLTAEGYACQIRRVSYEFQKGGNEMLRVTAP